MNRLELLRKRKQLLESARERQAQRLVVADRAAGSLAQQLQEPRLEVPEEPTVSRLAALSPIERKRERARMLGNPGGYAEVNRICDLPLIPDMSPEEVEQFNRNNVLAAALNEGWRYWPIQCRAIQQYRNEGGAFCPIGVGWGKTMVTQAIAASAYQNGLKRIMLLVPSQVVGQLTCTDFPYARKKIPIPYPVHLIGGETPRRRAVLARSGKKGLYILSYHSLSNKDASDLLEWIRPELIICDEADSLGNPKAARTKRVMGYVADHKPQGVCLSGTITSKSIKDYYHLIRWCLPRCPLPLSAQLASEWASKIDAQASDSDATGPIMPLVRWARENYPQKQITEDTAGFRRAYKLRLNSAPGVAASGDAEIGPSLVLHNEPVENKESSPGWGGLEELRRGVMERWTTPNGDEIEHAIHTYKWLYELSAGCYNELVFPTAERFSEDHGVEAPVADDLIELALLHHGSAQAYASTLRKWLEECSEPGLDTPMLVGLEMSKHGPKRVGMDLHEAWLTWKDMTAALKEAMISTGAHTGSLRELDKTVGRSLRLSNFVRVCPYKIDHAVKWAKSQPKRKGSILWVMHQGVGQWLVEAMANEGLDPLYCPAGDVANSSILDPKNSKRHIVASITAHGIGKNLQAFDRQLYVQWPRNAKLAEQSLGRMHRNGQKSDTVWACTTTSTEFDELCFAATLNDAIYIHQTTGNRQKLVYATYSPGLPRIFPAQVLRERGYQNRKLTPEQQQFMAERFGG